ncbi:MAG: hypothetical protein H7Z12_00110 [Rhodospirillaceae bacterium]|nr:hypothetical protein [Rhodospirillales bacterium]
MREIDHNKAVRLITDTLKGPVAAVYRSLVPTFGDMKGDEFYDTVLTSSDLLHGCLLIFRKHRDAFAHLLVDNKGRTVNDDFVRLKCGRTVHDIIAMIVRTHAKKQFHAQLGGNPNDASSPAGKLYQAMSEYLIHEWQVPLVPHYAKLPVAKVRELGPLLLDIKTAADMPGAKPETAAKPVEDFVDSHSREADFWWETVNDPQVRQSLGNLNERDMRELTAAFCQLGDATRANLLAPLGLSLYQAAVLLGVSYRTLGRAGFTQIFGKPGNGGAVTAFHTKLKQKNVSSRTDVRSLARAVDGVLATMPRPVGMRSSDTRAMAAQ